MENEQIKTITPELDNKQPEKKKTILKTLQGSVTQQEKDAFFDKCKKLNLSASEKVKELCMNWANQP